MAEGAWVVLGAAIGVVGSLVTTWLNAMLARDKLDAYDRAAMAILKEALEKGDSWQSLTQLMNLIGADEKDTKELLLMLGARARQTQATMWGLKSRNPFPDHFPSI